MNFNRNIKDLTNEEIIDMFEAYINETMSEEKARYPIGTYMRKNDIAEFSKDLYVWLYEELHP